MVSFNRFSDQEHFGRYWDALARGASPEDLERLAQPLDPEVVALVTQWRALRQTRRPQPTFTTRLEQDLMHDFAVAHPNSHPLGPLPLPSPNGLVPPRRSHQLPVPTHRHWSLVHFAIVMLVVAACLAAYVTFGPRNDHAVVPMIATPITDATPTADWPMYKGNPGRTSATSGPAVQGSPTLLWRFQAQGRSSRSPAVTDGVAYLQSGDGTLYALDALTGAERWRYDAVDVGENTPTVVGDTVYFTSSEGTLIALDASSGAERWRLADSVASDSTPLVVEGVVYIGGASQDVIAIDAATGQETWRTDIGGDVGRSVATADGLLYIGNTVGQLRALDATTGEVVWQFNGEDVTQGIGTPTVADGMVYANQAGYLYALDAKTGAEQWRKQYPGARPITAANGMLYSGGLDGIVYAIDAATGADRWTFATGDQIPAAPAVVGDDVYVASFDRTLYALDADTGTQRWTFDLDGQVDYGPSVANGVVYASTTSGSLYAIGGSDMAQLAAVEGMNTNATPIGATPVVDDAAAYVPAHFLWSIEAAPPSAFALSPQLTVAPNGDLWVLDGERMGFQIFAPDGTLRERWGSGGDGPGEFSFRRDVDNTMGGVAFTADGGFFVADSQNHRIQQFDANRHFVRSWGNFGNGDGQFKDPIGVNVDQDGNVYVIDDSRDDVQKFTSDGEFLLQFGGHGSEPGQLNFTGYGDVDPDGNLWITDYGNNRLQQFAPDGTLLQVVGERGSGPGQFNEPQALVIDSFGRIYVTDAANERVQVLDRTGQFLYAFNGEDAGGKHFFWSVGIAIDDQWGLYVLQYDNPRGEPTMIQKFQLT